MARALICMVLAVSFAHADTAADAQAIEKFLAKGQSLFADQEYAAAIQALSPVTRDVRATRAQRLRALEIVALAHFIKGDQGSARATFERIRAIDPGTAPPKPAAHRRSADSSTSSRRR